MRDLLHVPTLPRNRRLRDRDITHIEAIHAALLDTAGPTGALVTRLSTRVGLELPNHCLACGFRPGTDAPNAPGFPGDDQHFVLRHMVLIDCFGHRQISIAGTAALDGLRALRDADASHTHGA